MKNNLQSVRERCLADIAAESYGNRLHRYLLRRMGPNAAEDLVQEVYVRLLQVPLNDFIRDPESYIFTVARRVVGEFARREQRRRATIHIDSEQLGHAMDAPELAQPDEPAHWASSTELLQRFFESLRPELQAALLLHVDGHTFAEIAIKLEISERAARRYVDDARQALRQALACELTEEPSGVQDKRRRKS